MPITVNCEKPKNMVSVDQGKCLPCLSESQLKMLLVVVLNDYLTVLNESSVYTLPDDIAKLIKDGACYSCFSQTQLLQIILILAANVAYSGNEMMVGNLIDKGKCLPCASPDQVNGALMRLLCQISDLTEQKLRT